MMDPKKMERKFMLAMLKMEVKFAEMQQKFTEVQNAEGKDTLPVQGNGQPQQPGEPVQPVNQATAQR